MRKLIIDLGDDKAEAIESLVEVFEDSRAVAIEHVRVARKTLSDCIDAATNVYLTDLGPVGDAFQNFAQQLREAEHDLSRAEGELAE